jgi:uncharacterized membrane protein
MMFGRIFTLCAGCALIAKSLRRRSLKDPVLAFVGFELVLLGVGGRGLLHRRRFRELKRHTFGPAIAKPDQTLQTI